MPSKNPKNKIKINDYYFDEINTLEKAYFLGIMYTDGCVWFDKDNKPHIQLKMIDYDVIENFKKAISSEHSIREEKDGYRIVFRNRHMAESLIKHGCTPRKTFTIKMPKLDNDELTWAFIIGCIDGDGSLLEHKLGSMYMCLCSASLDFLYEIKNFLDNHGFIYIRIDEKEREDNTYRIITGNRNSLIKLYHHWTKTVYMKRKFEKLEKHLSQEFQVGIKHPLTIPR